MTVGVALAKLQYVLTQNLDCFEVVAEGCKVQRVEALVRQVQSHDVDGFVCFDLGRARLAKTVLNEEGLVEVPNGLQQCLQGVVVHVLNVLEDLFFKLAQVVRVKLVV